MQALRHPTKQCTLARLQLLVTLPHNQNHRRQKPMFVARPHGFYRSYNRLSYRYGFGCCCEGSKRAYHSQKCNGTANRRVSNDFPPLGQTCPPNLAVYLTSGSTLLGLCSVLVWSLVPCFETFRGALSFCIGICVVLVSTLYQHDIKTWHTREMPEFTQVPHGVGVMVGIRP